MRDNLSWGFAFQNESQSSAPVVWYWYSSSIETSDPWSSIIPGTDESEPKEVLSAVSSRELHGV